MTQALKVALDLDIENLPVGFYSGYGWSGAMPSWWAADSWGYLLVENLASAGGVLYAKQTLRAAFQDRIITRTRVSGHWTPWVEQFHTGNILGTVSHSSGVPTGAIIERGSNANGEYIKWADGTLECWQQSVTVACTANVDLDVLWPLPATFSNVNAAVTCTLRSRVTTDNFVVSKLQGSHTSAAACTMRVRFSATQSYLLTFHAKGRWY